MSAKASELSEEQRRYHLDKLAILGAEMKAERRILGLDPDKGPCPYCGQKPLPQRPVELKRDSSEDARIA